MKHAILIAAGYPAEYGPKVGWDDLYDTLDEAQSAMARAERNDGWSARVLSMTEEEAEANGWE